MSAGQAGDDLERAGVLERRGQEGGAAERMQMGGGRVKPDHLHLSAFLLARRETDTDTGVWQWAVGDRVSLSHRALLRCNPSLCS